tara:strand:- start:479 stop:985 length:507 start_codon:yes stop_codon:yes gene_type:complete
MSSKTSHNIKKRNTSNDVFITPLPLAKKAIDMISFEPDDIWFDPFKNNGSYYNQFPNENKVYTEILENKDFFLFRDKVDIICSNPPYSLMDAVIKKSIELEPHTINYLIGIGNLTARRIEMFEKAGYGMTKMHMCKVFKWYGMSVMVQFEKGKDNVITYDREVWRETE